MIKRQRTFLVDLDHTLYDVDKKILYSDSIDLIEFLKSKGRVVLFTEGDVNFQKVKIEKLGLNDLFLDNTMVFPSYSKMNNFKEDSKFGKIILIDDNPQIINQARKRGWKTVRVIRGRHKDVVSNADYSVDNLLEIKNLNIYD